MKKIRRTACLLLAIMLAFSAVALTGCNQQGETDNPNVSVDDYAPTEQYTGGTHQKSVKQSSDDFIKDGACEWTILLGKDAGNTVEKAAYEFTTLFQEATGIELATVKSDEIAYSETTKYLSFGNNAYAKAAGITLPSNLKSNGYIIKTVGKSVFVIGGKDLGTLFGAYGLLNELFGYEYYFGDTFGNDCYALDRNVTEKKLPIIDIFDNPDFDHAIAGYMPMHTDSNSAHKMRMETIWEVYITGTGISYVHNTLQYMPTSRYQSEHPKWYSLNGQQLCYTARGDDAERTALIEELSRVMIQTIKDQPDSEIITLTQMDSSFWCECDACRDLKTKYGTDAASCIMFTNEIADKIEAWRAAEAPERKITVVMFAYTSTENPPAVKGADGNWTAVDNSVKLHDNVCVLFAPIYSMSFNHQIQDEVNVKTEEQIKGWEACADHISVWSYSAMFYNYFMPYDTYATCQNQYKRWLDAGALWIFDNAQYDTNAPLGFSSLKAYLNSAWSWDVNRSYNELVDGFFEHYFGSKDGSMRKFYNELRIWLKGLDDDGVSGLTGTSHPNLDDEKYWSRPVLEKWLDYCDAAKEEIAGLKTSDPSLYQVICDRIDIESLMPRYMLLEFYSSYFSAENLVAERKLFAADCERLGVTKFAEAKSIDLLTRNW